MNAVGLVLTFLLVAFFAFVGGVQLQAWFSRSHQWSDLVDGSVEWVNCYDKGCSLLVRRADSSSDWVWVPPVEQVKREKK